MKFIAFSFVALLASTSAYAGGYVSPVGPGPIMTDAESVADWTGFYAGIQLGVGDATLSYDGESESEDITAGGWHVGYMRDLGKFIIGGEFAFDRVVISDAYEDEGAYLGRLRGRVGYDAGRFMPYISLGTAALVGEEDDDLSESGVSFGIGAAFQVTDHFLLGLDYSRSSFSDVLDVPGVELDADLVQVRASYQF